VRRSGRDEPMWVAVHTCMKAMLGISLYSYLYLKVAKMLFFFLSLVSSIKSENKKVEQVLPRKGWGRSGEVVQTTYTHVSKRKNGKRKKKIKRSNPTNNSNLFTDKRCNLFLRKFFLTLEYLLFKTLRILSIS
jgi:hypothetical protein